MTPESWELTTVGQLGAAGKPAVKAGPFGSTLKKGFYVPSGFKVYGQEQVIAKDPFFGDYYIDENKYLELSSCAVEPGDILLSLVGTVGRVLLLPEGSEPGIINPRLLRLSLDKRRVHGPFMAQYLESDLVVNRLESWAQGGTMGVLNAQLVRDLPVLLPPIPEQHQIARVLDTWDTAIRAVEKVAAAKRERKLGLMQVLLTGKKRFKEFRLETWRSLSFDKLARLRTNRRHAGQTSSLPCVELEHIQQGTGRLLGWVDAAQLASTKTVFRPGDVLFGKLRPYLRKYWHATMEGLCSTEIWVLEPWESITSEYLFYLVQSDDFLAAANVSAGSRMPRADWNYVASSSFLIPQIEEQRRIASVLFTADSEIENLEKQLAAYRLQKRGLMQQLLTGKKRVKVEDPETIPA